MPSALILVIAVAAAILVVEVPIRWAVTILLAALFLVPDTVQVPSSPHWLTVPRLVVFASALGIVLRVSRGEMSSSVLRPGRVHAALGLLVVFAYFVGVDAALPPATFSSGWNLWLGFLDQLLLLFTIVAFARVLGIGAVATRVVVILSISAGIGVWEHFDHHSFARFWFEKTGNLGLSNLGHEASSVLEKRGGRVRVRSTAEFALEFGWILIAIVPLATAVAIRSKRLLAWLFPAVIVAAAVFTVSRSPFIGVVAGVAVMLAVSRFERRLLIICAIGVAVGGLLYLGPLDLRRPYHGAPADSIASRKRRLVLVGDTALAHPYTGIGLAGLGARGLSSTDDSYLLTYASLGVLGFVLLGAALVTPTVVGAAAAINEDDRDNRLIAAGAVGGIVAIIISAASYDAFQLPAATAELWILAGLVVVAADKLYRRPMRLPSPARVVLPVAGVVVGLAISALAPTGGSAVMNSTVSLSAAQVSTRGDFTFVGQVMTNTACRAGTDAIAAAGLKAEVSCIVDVPPGLGTVRLAAKDRSTLDQVVTAFDDGAARVDAAYTRVVRTQTTGEPTTARTAPVWGGLIGLLLAIFLPPLRRLQLRTPTREYASSSAA